MDGGGALLLRVLFCKRSGDYGYTRVAFSRYDHTEFLTKYQKLLKSLEAFLSNLNKIARNFSTLDYTAKGLHKFQLNIQKKIKICHNSFNYACKSMQPRASLGSLIWKNSLYSVNISRGKNLSLFSQE